MSALAPRTQFDRADQLRRTLIAKVKVAQKEMGLVEDDYRAMMLRVTGKMSAADCGVPELAAMVEEMKRLGFQPKRSAGRGPSRAPAADHPAARKARALWISLYQLGAIQNSAEQALEAFARRQLHVERLQWANQGQAYKLIEALKAIAERHGWSQDTGGVSTSGTVKVLKLRLCEAILDKLRAQDLAGAHWTLEQAAFRLLGLEKDSSAMFWPIGDLDLVAQGLGAKLQRFGA